MSSRIGVAGSTANCYIRVVYYTARRAVPRRHCAIKSLRGALIGIPRRRQRWWRRAVNNERRVARERDCAVITVEAGCMRGVACRLNGVRNEITRTPTD